MFHICGPSRLFGHAGGTLIAFWGVWNCWESDNCVWQNDWKAKRLGNFLICGACGRYFLMWWDWQPVTWSGLLSSIRQMTSSWENCEKWLIPASHLIMLLDDFRPLCCVGFAYLEFQVRYRDNFKSWGVPRCPCPILSACCVCESYLRDLTLVFTLLSCQLFSLEEWSCCRKCGQVRWQRVQGEFPQ